MQINILKLRHAPGEKLTFQFNSVLGDIEVSGQHFRFVGPVAATGEIVSRNNHFQVTGVTKATILAQCVSCLESFALEVEGSLEEIYTRSEDINQIDPSSEMIGFMGDNINIEPEVIKSLIIELPMRLICSPECQGLCQQCGSNLNKTKCNCQNETIDPRLAVLKKLQQ